MTQTQWNNTAAEVAAALLQFAVPVLVVLLAGFLLWGIARRILLQVKRHRVREAVADAIRERLPGEVTVRLRPSVPDPPLAALRVPHQREHR